ncbi:MAG: hypothetical protein KKE57_09845 [Proteobacteria bacterium]|nr:hypothetical protein [Pseudomonadota bacterium]
MTPCTHQHLVLVRSQGKNFRCRHCHLTIGERELGAGYCPECLEVKGLRHRDFDVVEAKEGGTSLYRCEGCSALIDAG